MLVIRPVAIADLDDLLALAHKAGKGMTSLPTCPDALTQRIKISLDSFARTAPHADDYFLLVMEDLTCGKVVGTAAVYSQTGARQAFYAYRVMSVTHYSHSLGKQTRSEMLHLTNDCTDCSEVGTLFLDPDYRGNGHWLSRARYLLMGQFQERFQSHVIAELRGWVDEQGQSPFWNAIGEQFFEMDFDTADRLSGTGSNQFITELMPKHPIYTCLLPQSARDVIGKPNKDGIRAKELLEAEGFAFDKVVDIFDGGPLMKARIDQIKSVRRIAEASAQIAHASPRGKETLVATDSLANFRVIHVPICAAGDGNLALTAEDLDLLGVEPGMRLRYIPSNYQQPIAKGEHL